MPSRTSYFNKGVFFNNIKRFWLITFSYTFFLLLLVMSYLRMYASASNSTDWLYRNQFGLHIFDYGVGVMSIFIGFFTLVTALAVFSYMHFTKNTAMVHALPLRRETLFVTNYLSGLFIVTFPLVFNSAVLVISGAVMGFPSLSPLFVWFAINLDLTFLLYSFAVFAGMFTGHMAAQAIFFLIYNFLALFLETMFNNVLSDFLFGYISTNTKFKAWSPLYYMSALFSGFSREEGNVAAIIVYIIAGALFTISALFLYKKRQMEVASDVISFPAVKPIFKYSVSVCSAALLGSLLVSVLDIHYSLVSYILAYLVGGLIGYFSSEMLVRKTFKVLKAYKGFVVFALILSLLLSSIYFDFWGYETYVPQDAEVELMSVSTYRNTATELALWPENYDPLQHRYWLEEIYLLGEGSSDLSKEQIQRLRSMYGVIESREAITKARRIHSYITENHESLRRGSLTYISVTTPVEQEYINRSLYFIYRLKDGRRVERSYSLLQVGTNSELDQLLRDYLSLPEVMVMYNPILERTAQDIVSITVNFNTKDGYKSHVIGDIEGFLTAYQKDILAQDPLQSLYPTSEKSFNMDVNIQYREIDMQKQDSSSYFMIKPEHKEIVDFLTQQGIVNPELLQ